MSGSLPRVFCARRLGVLAVVAALAGCGTAPAPFDYDPYEKANRANHAFNKGLDTAVLRPVSQAYGAVVPGPVRSGVSNLANHLDLPRDMVNYLLQGRPVAAMETALRFTMNTTFGVAGLLDPATDMGLRRNSTDFGETLHVWGLAEGAYVELPALGPATERDAAGKLVDFVLNPTRALTGDPARVATAAGIGSRLGDRDRYSDTIDSVLYQSADSYAQTRLLYLQNRRFELGQTAADDTFIDPYED
ncbi:MAG: VacJ family lipoprotein [Rhodobacterales bacterium]|nr:VacJ family lipoprotein [Rhodobacterales bacterium]